MNFKIKNQAGFTLIEVMVSVAIFGIILAAVYATFNSQFNSYSTQEDVSSVQADIRSAAEMLTRDIRNGGFGVPTGGSGSPPTIISAATATSLSLNLAGTTTYAYLTSANYTVGGPVNGLATYTVAVSSTAGFNTSQTYNLLDLRTKTIELGGGAGRVISVNTGAGTITVNGALPTGEALNVGDLVVVPAYAPVIYQIGCGAATTGLYRFDTASNTCAQLSDKNTTINFWYSADGITYSQTPPSSLGSVISVRFVINGGTLNNVSLLNGVARSRTVDTTVAIRNF